MLVVGTVGVVLVGSADGSEASERSPSARQACSAVRDAMLEFNRAAEFSAPMKKARRLFVVAGTAARSAEAEELEEMLEGIVEMLPRTAEASNTRISLRKAYLRGAAISHAITGLVLECAKHGVVDVTVRY